MRIILGSSSKWRRQIMDEMGYEFEVMAPDIDEKAIRHTHPSAMCLAISLAKNRALRNKITVPAILITADQVAVCNGEVREKPQDADEARRFLKSYAGYPVTTHSAVTVSNTVSGWDGSIVDVAQIWYAPFSDQEIEALIQKGDVFSCAGAFASGIPEFDQKMLKIEGTLDSVMGLPKEMTRLLIESALV